MALVNPNIAMSYRAPEFQPQNQLAQYAQMQQILGGQQEQQLNALKMQEYERARTEQEGWNNYLAQADLTNPQTRIGALKYGKRGAEFGKALSEQEKDVAATASSNATAQKTNIDNSRSLLVGVNDQPAYDAWRAYSVSKIPELANILPAQFTPEGKDSLLRTAEDLSKQLTAAPTFQSGAAGSTILKNGVPIYTVPEKAPAPTELQRNYEYATKQGFKGDIFAYEKALKEAGRPPAQPRAEQPLEKVVDPVTGKVVFASREEALRGRMTPAAAMESLPPKEIQKREAAFPQATSSLKGFESKSELFIRDLEQLRDDTGLNKITGPVFGRTPSASREGSRAQATYNKVFAKGGFEALQDMRDASKTGGALGNVSNQEGERLERSIVGGLDRTQNIEDVKKSIDQLIDDIRGSKIRMREAYDDTYSYKSGNESTAKPAPAATGNVVVTPDGRSHTFPTPAAAAQFKKAAGL